MHKILQSVRLYLASERGISSNDKLNQSVTSAYLHPAVYKCRVRLRKSINFTAHQSVISGEDL